MDNVGAAGLDLGSEARRRSAIELAIDSAAPAMTAPIALVQDNTAYTGGSDRTRRCITRLSG